MTTPFPFVANTVLTAAQLNAITTLPVNAKTANYTLVVGDVGQRVQMTAAGSTTITVNTGIFAAGDTIWIQNLGAGTCTITAGTATVSTASSLALAQYGGGTLVFQSASAATFFSQQAASYGAATGGTSSAPITVGGVGYTLLSFLTDLTLTVTRAGYFDVVMVAGGAGGGAAFNYGGGGGAGGVIQSTIYLPATTYAVTVGAGGTGTVTRFMSGFGLGSEIAGYLSTAGGGAVNANLADGLGGGSGGGATSGGTSGAGPAIAGSQGKNGGTNGGASSAGAGGGFSSVGANGSGTTGGAGGTGLQLTTFTGSTITTWIGCGGGGAGSVTQGAGGNSTGGTAAATGGNATTNSGSGGGGSSVSTSAGGNGSAGAVYIRFKS